MVSRALVSQASVPWETGLTRSRGLLMRPISVIIVHGKGKAVRTIFERIFTSEGRRAGYRKGKLIPELAVNHFAAVMIKPDVIAGVHAYNCSLSFSELNRIGQSGEPWADAGSWRTLPH